MQRRRFLQNALAAGGGALLWPELSLRADSMAGAPLTLGDTTLMTLSDGHLVLPLSFVFPESIDPALREEFIQSQGFGEAVEPPLNVTLWRNGDRTMLFDAGSGANFMSSAGLLFDSLAEAGIDPAEITDVIFTHAHPDHLWGIIDDFDEISFPEASLYINEKEWDYWRAEGTLAEVGEERQSFVAGARNRFDVMEERVTLFKWGDEVVPGVEAVDTHGHTPGHTSFMLHAGNDAFMVIGDAIATPYQVALMHPEWPAGSDQNPEAGIKTRTALLDRLAGEQLQFSGYHLPDGGVGRVEKTDNGAYRFIV